VQRLTRQQADTAAQQKLGKALGSQSSRLTKRASTKGHAVTRYT